MANNIQVLINTGNPDNNKTVEVLQGGGKSGKPTTIKAVKGARYQLEEQTAKNTAPENIRSKRVGKNLHVMLNGSKDADLIIENYYDEEMLSDNNRGLYGRAEDGKIYEYIPEDPTREGMPINLADGGRPVSQVLGGLQVGEAFELSGLFLAAAGGGFGALTAGAAALGAAALAGGGGGGGGAGTDPAATALASIKAAAENNTATSGNLGADVFTAAGVTGVDASNLAAIQSALDSAAVNGVAADTKPEVQAIVDAYNAIKANADGTPNNNATNPTQAQYAAIGVTGVDTANKESLLGDAIDGKPFSAVDTVAEVQTLANAAAAVMTGAAGGTAPTKAQLEALGITGVTDANLSAIQAAIAATPDNGTGVDTLSELQAVANTGATNAANAAAALSAIAAAAQANDATDTNVAASVFATAGVTGVDSSNVAAIQSALNSAAVIGTSADTKEEVQAIVDAYNAIKANADGTANNNATNPTQAQYAAIGVTGVDSNVKASLLGDVVDSKPFSAVDTVAELQTLADAAAAVMTAAAGTAAGNGPTLAQLTALGITGVTPANLAAVQASIARTADDGIGVDTLAELQAVATIGIDAAAAAANAAAAITVISAAAQANNATDANVAASVFVTAGVTGVDSTNVAAIQSALNSANVNGVATDTLVEIQNIVNAYNAIRENADGTANNYASNPTQAEYALIGVTGVDSAAKESLLGDAIDGKPFSAVDSVPEVQALADAAAAVMTGAAGGAAPTQAQLAALGITGVTPANLAAVLAAIAATPDDGTGVDTLSELQAVATAAAATAAALDTIKAAAEGNTATSGNLAASVFTAAGVTGVDASNLAAIQSALDSTAVNGAAADTKPEVQAIVDAYNAIKANADGIPNNNATNPTQAQYAAIGVTGVSSAPQESLLGDAIDGKPFSAVDSVPEVQTLADAAAAVIASTTTATRPTLEQLTALGITGVTPANLAAVQAAIAATGNGGTGVDTLSELQAVTDAATATAASAAALDLIKTAAANNTAGTTPSLADFVTAGITGVDSNNFAAINSALNSLPVDGNATDTKSEVQAIVNAYNTIKANADDASATNATYAQYTAVGVTGIDNTAKANLLGDVVDTKAFADVDSVPELQTLATAAAAVISGATAGGTVPSKAQLEALGITGVTDANLAAIQAAIANTPDDGTGVDTLNELQTVVTNAAAAAAATAAALSTIAAAAQANNASDTNVPASVFVTAGINGVTADNLAAIQSALNDTDVQSGQADTAAKVQAVVDAYNAIKANADTASTANATQAQYAAIGVNGIDNAAKTNLLGDVVDTKAFADVDTVDELQTLATAAAAVISGATAGGTVPTQAQLAALGITGVTTGNLAAVLAAIANTADDGTGVDSISELQNIVNAIVATTNDAPTGTSNTITVLEDGNKIFAASDFGFADASDSPANALSAVIITTLPTAGTLKLNGTTVTLNQSIAATDLANLVFAPAANANGTGYATIGFKVQDNGGTANGGVDTSTTANTLTFNVTAVNDAPTASNATITVLEDGSKTFAASDFGFTDVDSNTLSAVIITTLPGAGTLKLNGASVTANQSIAAADLVNLVFAPAANANGTGYATIGFKVQDNGGTANGGVDTSTTANTLTFNVTAVNDAPTASNATITVLEDGSKTFAAADFGFADASDSPANTLQAVIITTVPGAGTLKLNGTDVTVGQSIAVANLGNLVFAPAANANGAPYATIGFKVQDNGGTANGGADTSTSANTLTFNVTAVNDAATFSGDISKATSETNVAQTITGQLNVTDIDSATTVVAQTNVAGSAGLGKFTINSTGAWSYVMDSAQNQLKPSDVITDSLTVSTADGTTQTISVVITGTNDAPIVANALADTTATANVAITNYVVPANAFSDVDSTSLTYTATLADGSALSTVGLSFDATTRTVSGTPSAGTAGSTLSVKVTASDGSLSAFDTFDIVVASPDSTAPTLLSASPADNGTVAYANVANNLTLTFSEAVKAGTGVIELYNASNTLVESFDVATSTKVTGWNGSTLTINPTADLAAGTGYYVKVATTAIKDMANNAYAGITDATTLNFTVSAGAGSVIDLGTGNGRLITPVQVEGKWYYFWDKSSVAADTATHDELDAIFKYDINGNLNPNAGTNTNDVYRYATLNGVQVALPTINGNISGYAINAGQTGTAATVGDNSVPFDEWLAIWDTHNGTGTTATANGVSMSSGLPNTSYWTASASSSGGENHIGIELANAMTYATQMNYAGDTGTNYVVMQVVAANSAPVLADTVLTLTGVSAGAAAPVNGTTTGSDLVSSLVGGITDADAGATKGIAITGVHAGATLYYSVDGGTTWLTATSVSDTNALLLAADSNTRVYYKANGTTGTISDAITFRAWDMTANITEGVYTDTTPRGGKAQFSTATDTVAVTSTVNAGDTVINLGTYGQLIAPVQVEGKWYYYWDASGNGTYANTGTLNSGHDYFTHDQLDAIFNQDINGNVNPNAGTNTSDVYRYATINGVQLALPTLNGNLAYATGNTNQTATTATTGGSSAPFDDMLAIWDTLNGTNTTTVATNNGMPAAWGSNGASYWTATPTTAGHAAVSLEYGGQVGDNADTLSTYVVLNVVNANTAPVLDAAQSPTLTAVSASAAAPSGAVGDWVSTLVGGITDADAGATKGIAITGVHSGGTLYYSLNGGGTWTAASGLSNTNALLLASDADTRVYFMPNGASGTIPDAITFRAWDMTQHITEGVYASTSTNGIKSEFSTATDTVSVVSTDPGVAQVQAAVMGLSVTGFNQTATGINLYENHSSAYTVPAGTTISLHKSDGTVIQTFVWSPGAGYTTSFTALTGLTSGQQFYGTLDYNGVSYRFNTGLQFNGASAPTATTYGSPLVLDLNGDGVHTLAMSEGVSFDLLNTGSKQTVGWVDKHDGLLAIDLNGDGQINSGAELFGDHTQLANGALAKDGWAALTAMDTNGDGKVDAQDANFDKLRVWVDANSDGVTDAGELHTLAEAKVASINLHADTTQTMQNGNWLEGFSSFTSTDGVTHEMVDAWLQMAATGVKTLNNGESLDLSTVSNLSLVTGVNMSADTAANTVKLNLADVLGVATDASIANGVHKLTLTGDANDTVELDLSQWANTGTTVTEGDHTYAVYNASSAAAAQLLIDQHMVLANHG
jgi:VCBS repeat-containing protein